MNKVQEFLMNTDLGSDAGLDKAVAEIIVSNTDGFTNEETIQYMEDVFAHGCISGCVSGLIYYSETAAFFDKYYEDIDELRNDYLEIDIPKDTDLKNFLAWFAFEWVTNEFLALVDQEDFEEEEAL